MTLIAPVHNSLPEEDLTDMVTAMSPAEHEEMTAASIARLAGVGRAAVSNWRRRYPAFPKPVGGDERSPTFSRAEVEAWLKDTGKGDQLSTAGRTDTGTQRVEPDTPLLPALRGDHLTEEDAEQGITSLESGQLLARAMAALLPRATAATRQIEADSADEPAVLDPACSKATLLMAVADRFGDTVKLVGQEIEEADASAAAHNLRSNAHGAPYEIHAGDSLLDNQLGAYLGKAAAVVCEPPLNLPQWPSDELSTDPRWEFGVPAPRDSELAWVQHCYAHLRPHGLSVIAVTPRTCVQPSGEHIRAELVRSGVLRDVIALPKGIGSAPATESCLWVLQRPYDAVVTDTVRMIDLSGLSDAADVPQEFAAWQRLFADAHPTIFRAVPRRELLNGDTNILPSRHITSHAETHPEDFLQVTNRLQGMYVRIGQGLPRFASPPKPTHHVYVTFGELERAGALKIRSRETTPRAGDLLLRTLGKPPVVATGGPEDDIGIAQVVEIDNARLDAHFLATFLRIDANALPVSNTLGVLSREDLRRCRVPRMSLPDQRRYGDAFRHLQQLEVVITTLAKTSTHVIEQTIHGLTTGVLAPEFTTTTHTDEAETADDETRDL
ncbi:N-6 DNA methylase [Streptomyces sp. NPDC060334]|uniref:N-6 DNA methylase n=1 Tax=Streptomyces sp. NPDC060334 TaxID=3347099 RepID=UPI00365D6A8C